MEDNKINKFGHISKFLLVVMELSHKSILSSCSDRRVGLHQLTQRPR